MQSLFWIYESEIYDLLYRCIMLLDLFNFNSIYTNLFMSVRFATIPSI